MQNRSLSQKVFDEKIFPDNFLASCESYTQTFRKDTILHYHNCVEIGMCTSGAGIEYIGDKLYNFYPDSIAIIQKGCIHDSHIITEAPIEKPSEWVYIFVDLDSLSIHSKPNYSFIFSDSDLAALFHMMYNELRKRTSVSNNIFKYLLEAFILKVNQIEQDFYSSGIQIPDSLLPAINYITCNFSHDITIDEVAAKCNISVSHFRKLFGEYMNCSPLEYLNNVRISAASSLLKTTDISITEIAGMTGFSSISSFNRQFKRSYDISPSQFRKKELK